MRLKSLTLNGFKSFPDRTRLDFGPGVSVVVGPNGSGKSNVTDAVLWAMGEQSPLAIRGQSMQDVIFGGGRGVQARSAAEVEIVLDNSDGTVDLPLSEISIVRRLDRNGEGGYRLNGARCRLTDVIEVLSDTGLGKETHSVISQGRVEAIVTSKARDRRMLIEEAAGLGKHRKRRRRAQLKLEHTQENLDRALDIEREARSRLRPLKRQAEAAELHERLERQILEARWELLRDALRERREQLGAAQAAVAAAREQREQIELDLEAVVARRGEAEQALAERAERHDALSKRVYEARSAAERLRLRREQVASEEQRLSRRIERVQAELAELDAAAPADGGEGEAAQAQSRVQALQDELAELELRWSEQLEQELAGLERELVEHKGELERAESALVAASEARVHADEAAAAARETVSGAEREVQQARRESARVGAQLAGANQFLRSHGAGLAETPGAPRALSGELRVEDGYELALAAALGGRLDAAVVADVAGAQELLDRSGPEGGSTLLAGRARAVQGSTQPPCPHARRLLDLLSGPGEAMELAAALLADAWVVERLEDVPESFQGIATTRGGRVWFAGWGEIRQLAEGGTELVLARRNERDRLVGEVELAAQAEQAAGAAGEQAQQALAGAEADRARAEQGLRDAQRAQAESAEGLRRAQWLIEQRRAAPAEGPLAVRRAELEGELAAERRQAEQREQELRARAARIARLRKQHEMDTAAVPVAERLGSAIESVLAAVEERAGVLQSELDADRQAGEAMTATLRACAAEEADIQRRLRDVGEQVTTAEVAAQRLRDQVAEAELESATVAELLGFAARATETEAQQQADAEQAEGEPAGEAEATPQPVAEPLSEERRDELDARVQRLTRRREQLGPVNPLAQEEYGQALEHVEELESQRGDLETALRELRTLIRDTDRQIEETFNETFEAAARNFEELVGDVFPGGSGRLRLVTEETAPRPVIGGQPLPEGESREEAIEAAAEAEVQEQELGEERQLPGVEIEITPAGKSSKRLTLLSGGEKSMTALAFLFAVFLARPCPFYILDEVEAALDDINLDRFLALLRRYSSRAQFIVITHQKRTMEAADWLFGVSMGGDGVSKVLSRRLEKEQTETPAVAEVA